MRLDTRAFELAAGPAAWPATAANGSFGMLFSFTTG
jgi:hypothetical protein